jgi:hypothetical protein
MFSLPNRVRAAVCHRAAPAGLLLAFLAGCGQTPPPATVPPAAAAPAPASAAAAGGAADPAAVPARASDRQDVTHRDGIEATVHYPALRDELAPLDRAMHAYADAQKAALAARISQTAPAAEQAEKPGRLDLDFTIATQTEDFVSALAEGQGEFGGAHPLPLRTTFTQHLASGRIVTLTDLFADADAALATFSNEARRRLEPELEGRLRAENLADKVVAERLKSAREMLEAGTAPKAENFSSFLVDGVDGKAIGITLIFPPAQVATYVEGAQQVVVPAKVFYAQLKVEYRDAFAVDKADIDSVVRSPRPVSP